VYASIRGDCLRIAPHLHNDDTDMDRLLAVLRNHRDAEVPR
jgi:selenocysteine lyase/cysteine desulfurase